MIPKKGDKKYAMKGKKDQDFYLQVITMIKLVKYRRQGYSMPEVSKNIVNNQVE